MLCRGRGLATPSTEREKLVNAGSRVVLNAVLNAVRRPLTAAITILLTPYVIGKLGKDLYGIWTLTGSLLAYTGLLRLGLNSAVDLHVPRSIARGDTKSLNEVVSTVMTFYTAAAIPLAAVVGIVVWGFPAWFSVPAGYETASRWVVALMGLTLLVVGPLSVYTGVLSGLQRYDTMVTINILFQVLRALLIVAVLAYGLGILGLAIVSALVELGTSLWFVYWAYRLCEGLRPRLQRVRWQLLKELVAYSASTLLFMSGQLLLMHSGKTLVGVLYGTAAAAEFAIPFMLLMIVGQMVVQGARVIKPATSLLEVQQRGEAIRQTFVWSTKAGFFVALPVIVACLVLGGPILNAWVGADIVGEGATLLAVMVVPQMLRVAHLGGFFVLAGLGIHRVFGIIVLVQSAAGLLLGYLFAELLGWGLVGVALGLSIPELVGSGLVVPYHCLKTMRLSVLEEWRACLAPAVRATLPFLAYCLLARWWLPLNGRGEMLLVLLGSCVPLGFGVWFLGMGSDERSRLKSYVLPLAGHASR